MMALWEMASPFFLFVLLSLLHTPSFADRKTYIVYLGSHSFDEDATIADFKLASESHYDMLASSLGSMSVAKENMIYSYNKNINAFAANLDEREADEIAKHPEVISVFPSKVRTLYTTRSWEMLGMEKDGRVPHHSLWTKGFYGQDVIVANIDGGVWPESESFKDDGMGPVPKRWKGTCVDPTDQGVRCNRKLIGSRFFNKGPETILGENMTALYRTPRDTESHGTHTLSTAAGRFVPNVDINGLANGTASGGAPLAPVASYKVCWPEIPGIHGTCFDVDILAAFEAAIEDGVDVLSLSLGSDADDYFRDTMAIGTFHAMANGIHVVASGGNSGPKAGSVSNIAPWIFTIGASTLDREFVSYATTGAGDTFRGRSSSKDKLDPKKLYPLIKSDDAAVSNRSAAQLCYLDSLDAKKVAGNIVVCLRGGNNRIDKSKEAHRAGAAGMILANANPTIDDLAADPHILPAVHITYSDGLKLYAYMNSTSSPVGSINGPTTEYGVKHNPKMASFSSRGPNTITPDILKPDVTAPGVDILAAYSQSAAEAKDPSVPRLPYNLMSGTSMSCPHVAGIVALLKNAHPEWSAAMIRSAIMTTARTSNNAKEPIQEQSGSNADPFGYGAGHVQPTRAMDPGLVYDLQTEDYLDFLCAIGYDVPKLAVFTKKPYACPYKQLNVGDFNYPSFAIPSLSGTMTLNRRLKNVGKPATYTVHVKEPHGFTVSVQPTELKFASFGEEKTFNMTVEAKKGMNVTGYQFGTVTWSDDIHYVRSPIAVSASG